MEASIYSPTIAPLWPSLKTLSENAKLELVSLLINSLRGVKANTKDTTEEELDKNFRSLAGCWSNDKDDDDIEYIIKQNRNGRNENRNVANFD